MKTKVLNTILAHIVLIISEFLWVKDRLASRIKALHGEQVDDYNMQAIDLNVFF